MWLLGLGVYVCVCVFVLFTRTHECHLQGPPGKATGVGQFTRQIVQGEGVLSLYKGLGAGITRQVWG